MRVQCKSEPNCVKLHSNAVALHGRRCRSASCTGGRVASSMARYRKKKRPEGRPFSNRRTRLFALLRVLPAVVMSELLANARRLAGTLAQIIELGTTYIALAFDLDARDQRRVRLKCALDALAAGNLAHHK